MCLQMQLQHGKATLSVNSWHEFSKCVNINCFIKLAAKFMRIGQNNLQFDEFKHCGNSLYAINGISDIIYQMLA